MDNKDLQKRIEEDCCVAIKKDRCFKVDPKKVVEFKKAQNKNKNKELRKDQARILSKIKIKDEREL